MSLLQFIQYKIQPTDSTRMRVVILEFFCIAIFCFVFSNGETLNDYYQKKPPVYCAAVRDEKDKDAFRKVRVIPELNSESANTPGLKLEHVQVILL